MKTTIVNLFYLWRAKINSLGLMPIYHRITVDGKRIDKSTGKFVFTGAGYRKLFPKLIALEEQAPKLDLFRPQAFIKPMQNTDEIKQGTDDPIYCENYTLKISKMQ